MTELATIVKSAMCRTRVKARPAPTLFVFPGLSSAPVYQWEDSTKATAGSSSGRNTNSRSGYYSSNNHQHIFKSCALALQRNYDVILSEYLEIRKSMGTSDYSLGSDEHKLHDGGWDWNSYILKGKRQTEFAVRCPRTVEILESFRGNAELMSQTPFSFAFFSTLKSGATIAPHYGPCNLRVRCHFPLIVPPTDAAGDSDCGMQVGDEQVKWEVGKPVFFDDCYSHHVWNRTGSDRVVLLFDLWHPELTREEIDAIVDMFDHARQQGWLKS